MKKIIYSICVISGIIFISSCGSPDKKAKLAELKKQQAEIAAQIKVLENEVGKDSATNEKSQMVQVSTASPVNFTHYIEVQGRVDSDKNIMLSPRSMGTVTKVFVTEGDRVTKGQVLATQDASIILKGMEQAKTGVEFARTVFEKQKKLWEQKIGSEVQYLQAKNNKEQAEAALANLQEQYQLTKFIAPFDGVVDQVNLKEGESPSPMSGIRIVNNSEFKVVAEIAEFYISKVKAGDEVEVQLEGLAKNIKAKVTTVGRTINVMNRTFLVEIKIPSSAEIKSNMIANVRILDYKNPKAITVPVNAIQQSEQGDYVFVAQNNKAVKKSIRIGQTYKGQAEITQGLEKGDLVITVGNNDLVEGQPVELVSQG
jgi:membrane fusion protein, multidrug efflux system